MLVEMQETLLHSWTYPKLIGGVFAIWTVYYKLKQILGLILHSNTCFYCDRGSHILNFKDDTCDKVVLSKDIWQTSFEQGLSCVELTYKVSGVVVLPDSWPGCECGQSRGHQGYWLASQCSDWLVHLLQIWSGRTNWLPWSHIHHEGPANNKCTVRNDLVACPIVSPKLIKTFLQVDWYLKKKTLNINWITELFPGFLRGKCYIIYFNNNYNWKCCK